MNSRKRIIKNQIAIKNDEGRQISYGDLGGGAERLKAILPSRSLIFILCDNSIETISFYYKVMYLRAVPLLLSAKIDDKKLEALIEIYKPGFIWREGEGKLQTEICVFEDGKYRLWKIEESKVKLHDELALLLMTSGSTGNSRIVRLSYRNLEASMEAALGIFPINQDDRCITTLPMNFTYGLSILHMHWYVGATVLATNHGIFDAKFWEFFEGGRATNFAGVTYTYKMLKASGFLKRKYPYLRFVSQGGDKMPQDLLELFVETMTDVDFYVLYGQTEGTVFVCGHNCKNINDVSTFQSVGKPLSNWKAEIRNEDSSGFGEVFILGDTVSMGYADKEADLALGNVNRGVLDTGDIGRIDEEGNVYIKGRKSRFLKLMGMRINLDDVEKFVKRTYPYIDCACTGNDDNLILYHTSTHPDIQQLQSDIAKFIQLNEKLISVKRIIEIPKTPTGKINYGTLEGNSNGL